MKKDCLMKVKTTCTLYWDYDSDCWDDDNPRDVYPLYTLNEDYELMRKGTILYVYENKDAGTAKDEYQGAFILLKNKYDNAVMTHETLVTLLQDKSFEIVEDYR